MSLSFLRPYYSERNKNIIHLIIIIIISNNFIEVQLKHKIIHIHKRTRESFVCTTTSETSVKVVLKPRSKLHKKIIAYIKKRSVCIDIIELKKILLVSRKKEKEREKLRFYSISLNLITYGSLF